MWLHPNVAVLSHVWPSQVTHINESYHQIYFLGVTHINESCHRAYFLVVTHINESCHRVYFLGVTHINESCHQVYFLGLFSRSLAYFSRDVYRCVLQVSCTIFFLCGSISFSIDMAHGIVSRGLMFRSLLIFVGLF